jgi:putative ABC transport system substrate-binding protein
MKRTSLPLLRREFITLLGGAAAWPVAARGQQSVRRVAVLMSTTSDEPESQARITALAQGLQEAGWEVGKNIRIDVRWTGGDLARVRKDAEELVALAPDVLVAGIGPTTAAFQAFTRTLPIVFTQAVDPVGLGTVKSMARPGRNATGFAQFEYGLSAKWLELLKEVVPRITRVGVVRDLVGFDRGAAPVSLVSVAKRKIALKIGRLYRYLHLYFA